MPLTQSGIAYESQGSGLPLVLLHGVTLDGSMWAGQVAAMAERFRCVTVDRRGHGGSAPLMDGADPALDLAEALDHAGVRRCHLVGLSLGGLDAVRFAGCFSERVASLLLVDAWLPLPEMTWAPPWRLAREQGPGAGRRAWLSDPLFAPASRDPQVVAAIRAMVERNDLSLWTRRVRGPEPTPPPVTEVASGIAIPTQVVVGELDLAPFHAVARWLQGNIPGAAGRPVAVVSDAGHMVPMERPEAFNRLLSDWLDSREQP